MAIDQAVLKSERDGLKEQLRTVETEQRRVEAELKALRQKEIKLKREIEALSTLLDLQDADEKGAGGGKRREHEAAPDA